MGGEGRRADILVVDDDAVTREYLRQMLVSHGYEVTLAASPSDARKLIRWRSFDLVLCDINMPGESGLSLAAHVAAEYPDTATVMVTGVDDADVAERTVAFGAYGYVVKPVRETELLVNVSNALRRLELSTAARRERDVLERQLDEHAAELRDALELLESRARARQVPETDTMRQLARAIEYRSRETGDHIERVGVGSALIAERLGMSGAEAERIRYASAMHDVGKVAVPDHILLKPGPLDPEERQQMERHSDIGHEVLRESHGELMDLAARIAWTHHERWDGGGYPRGLQREEIPLEGRIVAVADVFDALTHNRVYRPALPLDEAIDVMSAGRGTQFDPHVLDGFLDSRDTIPSLMTAVSGSAH